MADIKKPVSVTNKALLIALFVSVALIIILLISGFNRVNPYIIVVAVAAVVVYVYFTARKPKEIDIYEALKIIKENHYLKAGTFLDARDYQPWSVAEGISYLYLPYEGMLFDMRGKLVKGLMFRHLLKMMKENEKSKLFELAQRHLGNEQRTRELAKMSGIDLESLGLE